MFADEAGGKGDKGQSAAARAIKHMTGQNVSPASINRIISGKGGGSVALVRAVAKFLNEEPDIILSGLGKPGSAARKLKDLPGYEQAFAEAKKRAEIEHPTINTLALSLAGEATVTPQPERVSAGLLIQMALASPSALRKVVTLKR